MFSNVDLKQHRVVIAAPSAQEEKSTVLSNLAVTLAQGEQKTLMVDADLRRPGLHNIWGVDNKVGLTTMLLEDQAFQNPPLLATPVPGLSLLTSGPLPANPADVLASRKMEAVIQRLSQLADYILFDVPPVLVASDAVVLGRKVDGVLLVVRAGISRRDQIARAKEQFQRVNARLLGAVLTHAPQERSKNYG
jgi:non-specific protein-tyrosine kinase